MLPTPVQCQFTLPSSPELFPPGCMKIRIVQPNAASFVFAFASPPSSLPSTPIHWISACLCTFLKSFFCCTEICLDGQVVPCVLPARVWDHFRRVFLCFFLFSSCVPLMLHVCLRCHDEPWLSSFSFNNIASLQACFSEWLLPLPFPPCHAVWIPSRFAITDIPPLVGAMASGALVEVGCHGLPPFPASFPGTEFSSFLFHLKRAHPIMHPRCSPSVSPFPQWASMSRASR